MGVLLLGGVDWVTNYTKSIAATTKKRESQKKLKVAGLFISLFSMLRAKRTKDLQLF